MRKYLFVAFSLAFSMLFAQKSLPSVQVKKLNGSSFDVANLGKTGHPVVVSFWATWCSPCKKELDAISEIYSEWKEKYGVEVVAVSVDDARSAPKVKPTVEQKGWEFMVLLDTNQDFQRAMNIENVPFSFLINQKGEIIFEHSGYVSGDELELEEKLKELIKK